MGGAGEGRAGRFRVDLGNLLAQTHFLAPNLLLHKGKLRPREGQSLGMRLGGAPDPEITPRSHGIKVAKDPLSLLTETQTSLGPRLHVAT